MASRDAPLRPQKYELTELTKLRPYTEKDGTILLVLQLGWRGVEDNKLTFLDATVEDISSNFIVKQRT